MTNPPPPPERPSFFSIPESLRVWARFGGRFWGGVLAGIGLGFFLTMILIELEWLTVQRGDFPAVPGFAALLLIVIGISVTRSSLDSRPTA
jgi:hypothetical protein